MPSRINAFSNTAIVLPRARAVDPEEAPDLHNDVDDRAESRRQEHDVAQILNLHAAAAAIGKMLVHTRSLSLSSLKIPYLRFSCLSVAVLSGNETLLFNSL